MKEIKIGDEKISVSDNTDELSFISGYQAGIRYARKLIDRR